MNGSTITNATIAGSTVESVVADNLNMSNSNLTNATVSDAIITDNVINGSTNATIELTEGEITVNFTNVYEDVPLDELITNEITNNTNISVNQSVEVAVDHADNNYSITVHANDSINGTMKAAETIINPGGKSLPSQVSGTKFLFIDAPNFNSSVMRAATVRMKHYKTCAQFSSIWIQRFNESDPTSNWINLTSWCGGGYVYANVSGFSVYAIAGNVITNGNGGNGGGGGGGGAPPATDVTKTATVEDGKATVIFSSVSAGKTGTITIPDTADVPFKEIAIKVKNKVTNTKIEVYKLAEKPGDITEDISTGITHSYIQIDETNIEAADIDTVTIKFKVPVSWITADNIDKATVVLNRYVNESWTALTTTKTSEDSSYVNYSAVSPGLSVFGISGQVVSAPVTTAPVTTAPPTVAPTTTAPTITLAPTTAPPEGLPVGKVILALAVIAIIAGAAYYFSQKKKPGEESEVK